MQGGRSAVGWLTTMLGLLVALAISAPTASASEFLFRDNAEDGQIFSVRTDGVKGHYRWYLGEMGEFEATIQAGTRVHLRSPRGAGSVELDELGDVVLSMGGASTVLQEGAFGYQCYVATLRHHGTYRATDFIQEYVFRQAGTDGSLWSVKMTSKKHVYRWYLGALGRVSARVKGDKVSLKLDGVEGTMSRDRLGDVMLMVGGESIFYPEGSLGFGVFEATLKHAGTWRTFKGRRDTIFQDAAADGAIWKVVTGPKRGEFIWYPGALGRSVGTLNGRRLRLDGPQFAGLLYINKANELVLEAGREKTFLSASSLGYRAYKACLVHHGTWKEGLGEVSFIFHDASQDGTIWSVKRAKGKGKYAWDLGPMGRVDATVRGTTVSLRAEGMTGKVSVNDDNEVILSSGGDELVFQALSLGFNAYKATLQDAGTWRANIGQHDYLYRDVSTDGQLWSVRESRKRGRYIWYMGELGRAQVAVRGAKITISGQNVHATIDMGPKGDPVLRFFTAPGGMQIGEHVLHPGSAGQLCYQATTRHHRGR